MPLIRGCSHLLLDIEGTTCPVSFVAGSLFPYAARRLESFLGSQQQDPEVQRLLGAVEKAWRQDDDPEAQALWRNRDEPMPAAAYLQLLIQKDRKLTALKELQGMVWRAGYANGELVAPLFDDVAPALERWHHQGVVLAVYSSGSVEAQQLLYGHSKGGDLRGLFSYWFDTRSGAKQEPHSYTGIAKVMEVAPERVLFISDSLAECEAAEAVGMAVLFSDRESNPHRQAGGFARISDYSSLILEP